MPATIPPARNGSDAGPIRTCVGCRRRAPHRELLRIVGAGVDGVAVGRTLPGRGAWLCRDAPVCLDLALKRRAFPRALRRDIAPSALEALVGLVGAGHEPGAGVRG